MSHENNTELLEQGYELAEEITNHPSGYDKAILKAIEDNDLDKLRYLITVVNGELAQASFHDEGQAV